MAGWVKFRLPLLFGLLVLSAAAAVFSAPDAGFIAGVWPVGLATGMVLIAPRRQVPALLATIFVVAVVSVALSAQPLDVSIGHGIAVILEVCVAVLVLSRLSRTGEGGGSLRTDADLRLWAIACFASAVVAGLALAATSAITDVGRPGLTGLGVGIAHLASQMLITPFFLRLPDHGAVARSGERFIQWVVVLGITPLLLLSPAAPGLIFMTIPILAWGALRITPSESLSQLVGVFMFAVVLSGLGRGPFPADPRSFGVPAEIHGVLLSGFAITCAIIVVPLLSRVGAYVGVARAADAERYLVTNIVDSATGVAIIVADEAGRIVRFNPGAERLLGYRADEVMGEFTSFLHTEDAIAEKAAELGVAPDYRSLILTLVAEPEAALIRVRRKDGVERVHSVTVTQLTDASGRPTGYLSTSEDVTDTVDVEEALRAALAAEQRAVERLREVDAVKDTFVSTVSHELRTPLTSILGYLELLSDGSLGGLDPGQFDALLRVTSNSHRLLSLIEDLLTLSTVAEHGMQEPWIAFDLRSALESAHAVVAPACATSRRAELVMDLPETEVRVEGDREMLERVVVNLLGNAVKFTPELGSIHVELEQVGAEAVLRVHDSGIGIPEDEQAELFTRFFRSSLARGQAIPGSGLGLSISHSIVERHGGSIGVRSVVGTGTTVEVRLPLSTGNVQDSTIVLLNDRAG